MKRLLTFLVATVAIALIQTATVIAAEQITYFELEAVVDENANATITETIHYDFGDDERRGIFRDIPTSYVVSGDQGYNLDFSITEVTRDGQSEPYAQESNTANMATIRIGDPDVYITGTHQYTITYNLGPVAIAADDGNEIIRFDAPGTGWDIPVQQVRASIDGPVNASQQFCYIGYIGSTEQACSGSGTGFVAYSGNDVGQGKTITVEAVYDAGTFSRTATLETIEQNSDNPWPAIGIFGTLGFAGIAFGIKRAISAMRYRKRRGDETIYPRYEPPKDMSPAEIGLLIDNSVDGVELSATMLHFATSGYMKITQTQAKKFLRKPKYTFTKKQSAQGLNAHDTQLFNTLFASSEEVTLDELKKNTTFTKQVLDIRKKHIEQLEAAGFYGPVSFMASDLDARMTDSGYTKWGEIAGFKMFLEFTDKDRMAYNDAPEKNPEQFSQYLAYAVALGVEQQWANQFNDLMIDTSDWYVSPYGSAYTAGALTQLGSDLNTFATTASSSGTSGAGGGFSGGGFSGGGGGSW